MEKEKRKIFSEKKAHSNYELTAQNRYYIDRLCTAIDLQEIRMQKQLKLLRIKHQRELFHLANYNLKTDENKSLKEKNCTVRNNSTNKLNTEYGFLQTHNFMTEGKRDQKNKSYEFIKANALECLTEERKKKAEKKEIEQKSQEKRILRNLQRTSLDCALKQRKYIYDMETKDILFYKNKKKINSKKLEIDAEKKKKFQEKEEEIKKAKEKEELERIEKSNNYYNFYSYQNKFNEKWIALKENKKIQLDLFENERKANIKELRQLSEKGDIEKKKKIQNLQSELLKNMDPSLKKQLMEEVREEQEKKKAEEKKKKEEEKKEKRRKAIEKAMEIEKEKEKQKAQYTISSELEIIEEVQKYKSKRYDAFLEKVKKEKMKEKQRAEKLRGEKDEKRKMELEKKFQEERGKVAEDLRKEYSQIEVEAKRYEEKLREELKKKNKDDESKLKKNK